MVEASLQIWKVMVFPRDQPQPQVRVRPYHGTSEVLSAHSGLARAWISTSEPEVSTTLFPFKAQLSDRSCREHHRRQDAYPFLADPEAVSRLLLSFPRTFGRDIRKSNIAGHRMSSQPPITNICLLTAAAMCPPVTVVSASTARAPVVVVWPVVSTTTVPTSTSTTPVTSVRSVCATSTRPSSSSGSRPSTSTRYVMNESTYIIGISEACEARFVRALRRKAPIGV